MAEVTSPPAEQVRTRGIPRRDVLAPERSGPVHSWCAHSAPVRRSTRVSFATSGS